MNQDRAFKSLSKNLKIDKEKYANSKIRQKLFGKQNNKVNA